MNTKVPPGWSAVELPEVVDIAYGKNLPTTKLIDQGFAVYGANGQIGFYNEYNCEESEVLITCRGATCGTINVSPPKTFVTNNSMVLRPHDPTLIDRDYLRAAMLATDKRKVITGTAQPQITVANLSKHRIGLAPLNEQRRIVAKIEELTARSRAAKEALDAIPPLLERFRQSVLAAAFRGDLTKRWREQNPNVEPASELLQRIRQERRQRWEEDYLAHQKAKGKTPKDDKWKAKYQEPEPVDTTGLPELPGGWCWARWEEVGFCQNGRSFPSKNYQATGTKLLRPGNLHVSGTLEWTEKNTRYMPDEWAEEHQFHVVEGNEIVMNLTAQSLADEFLGRVCLTAEVERCLLNQRLARVTPVVLKPQFAFWLFKAWDFRRYVDTLNTGSLIQHMFTSQVYDFVFPLPPEGEQQSIISAIEERLSSKNTIELRTHLATDRFEQLSQSILAKAFRGELVPQDPNDEPASVLLERIRAERETKSAGQSSKKRKARK